MSSNESATQSVSKPGKPSPSTGELSLTSSGEVVLTPRKEAAKAPEGRRIHARRPIPPVPTAPTPPASHEEDKKAEDQAR